MFSNCPQGVRCDLFLYHTFPPRIFNILVVLLTLANADDLNHSRTRFYTLPSTHSWNFPSPLLYLQVPHFEICIFCVFHVKIDLLSQFFKTFAPFSLHGRISVSFFHIFFHFFFLQFSLRCSFRCPFSFCTPGPFAYSFSQAHSTPWDFSELSFDSTKLFDYIELLQSLSS